MKQIDLLVLQFLTQFRGRVPDVDALIDDISHNDLVKGGLILALLWWFWSKPDAARARRREVIIACAAGALVAAFASRFLIRLPIGHERPFMTPGLNFEVPSEKSWERRPGSFPSDHAALAFSLVTGLFMISRPLGLTMTAYVLVFVCLPRIYLGLHWPSDIIGGAVLGLLATVLATRERVRLFLVTPALKLLARSPQTFYVAAFLVSYGLMTRFDGLRSLVAWAVRTSRHSI